MRRFFLAGVMVVAIAMLQEKRPQANLRENASFDFNEGIPSFPAATLAALSFGYPHFFSSLLWLRFLQETPPRKIPNHAISWIYRDLNTVLDLDPDFYPAPLYGGVFLSTITEDREGAKALLEKGVKLFPDNWRLFAYLAYHYQFELNMPAEAARAYAAGAKLTGAPYFMGVLAARLLAQTNNTGSGILLLERLIQETKNPDARAHFEKKLQELRGKDHG